MNDIYFTICPLFTRNLTMYYYLITYYLNVDIKITMLIIAKFMTTPKKSDLYIKILHQFNVLIRFSFEVESSQIHL